MSITVRRRVLLAAPALWVLTPARSARAAPNTIRFARQFSMGYLQLNLMVKHAQALGLDGAWAEWLVFNAPGAPNGALISGTTNVVSGGIPSLVTLWSRTVGTAQEVSGVCALSSQPCLLNTRRADVRSIADLGEGDKIAEPTVKVSIQAMTLQMAAARQFGPAQFARLDPLTVSMAPPDPRSRCSMAGSPAPSACRPFRNGSWRMPASAPC